MFKLFGVGTIVDLDNGVGVAGVSDRLDLRKVDEEGVCEGASIFERSLRNSAGGP
jgi:hypothetical protein